MNKKILIIGGGPAGMTAAIFAARAGASVSILEHGNDVGRKILSTGGGRSNLTNERIGQDDPSSFYVMSDSADKEFCGKSIRLFGLSRTKEFFASIGLVTVSKDGYLYPRSLSAASVRQLLIDACRAEDVSFITDAHVLSIHHQTIKNGELVDRKKRSVFLCKTVDAEYTSDAVILACGGIAAPVTGSDGSGLKLAKTLGLAVRDPLPALLPLKGDRRLYRALAGLRIHGKVSLFADGKYMICDTGELQFTEQFVSGIPVFNVSAAAVRAMHEGRSVSLVLDLLPEFREKELIKKLFSSNAEKRMLHTALNGLLPEKACAHFLKLSGLADQGGSTLAEIGEDALRQLIRILKDFEIPVSDHPGPERAQTSSGGVRTNALDPATMEAKALPGLYLAGEMIDVTGICGGYNLQWAWTSGALAGKAAAR